MPLGERGVVLHRTLRRSLYGQAQSSCCVYAYGDLHPESCKTAGPTTDLGHHRRRTPKLSARLRIPGLFHGLHTLLFQPYPSDEVRSKKLFLTRPTLSNSVYRDLTGVCLDSSPSSPTATASLGLKTFELTHQGSLDNVVALKFPGRLISLVHAFCWRI